MNNRANDSRQLYSQQVPSILQKQFIYIVGSARSGTSWLQALIAGHQNVATTVELRAFLSYVAPLMKAWIEESELNQAGTPFGLPAIISEEEFSSIIQGFLTQIYTKVLELNPIATHILDKHPENLYAVDIIERFIPNARYIHIIRDGRDVCVSRIMTGKDLNWFSEKTYKQAAKKWKQDVLMGQGISRLSERYLEIRYEELIENGSEVLEEVFAFCGLKVDSEFIRNIIKENSFANMKQNQMMADHRYKVPFAHFRKGQSGGWQNDLSSVDCYVIDHIAGDLLEKLNYAESGWWYNNMVVRYYAPISYHAHNILELILKYVRKFVYR